MQIGIYERWKIARSEIINMINNLCRCKAPFMERWKRVSVAIALTEGS
jgi:hypothetical protein